MKSISWRLQSRFWNRSCLRLSESDFCYYDDQVELRRYACFMHWFFFMQEQVHTGHALHPNSKIHLFRENLKYICLWFTLCVLYIGMLMWSILTGIRPILTQALSAEDEAPSLPHVAGSLQKTGSSVSGTTEHEHPGPPHLHLQHWQNPRSACSSC